MSLSRKKQYSIKDTINDKIRPSKQKVLDIFACIHKYTACAFPTMRMIRILAEKLAKIPLEKNYGLF